MKKMLISIMTGILILNLATVFLDFKTINNNIEVQGIIYELEDEDFGGFRS